MHYYAFGSICRGELDASSDLGILVCCEDGNPDLPKEKYSIYTYSRIEQLWEEGNPFAWHLHTESSLIYSDDSSDFLRNLGSPSLYTNASPDCLKFYNLFRESLDSLYASKVSAVFNISCMFLAIRNFSTCHSLAIQHPSFSRYSPFHLPDKLDLTEDSYKILLRARVLSTRGLGTNLTSSEIEQTIQFAPKLLRWMEKVIEVNNYE